ncbi:MAG: rhodanese-like domain-containing protein [Cyanobacteriota bacterium]|nr:rhodanese-like domain-containing protein [Cyanobacteriota bacterium]
MSKAEAKNILKAKDKLPEVTPTPEPQQKPVSSASALKNRLDWGEPAFTIIDVRDREAFNEERIKGAITMSTEELEQKTMDSLDKERDIYIYGDSDEQAKQAADKFRGAGFSEVSQIQGGLNSWKAISGSTEGRVG